MDDLVHLRSPRGRYWRDLGAGLSEDIATAHAYSRADAERLVARLNDGTTIVEIEKPAIAAEREVSKMQQHQFNIGDLVRMRSGGLPRGNPLALSQDSIGVIRENTGSLITVSFDGWTGGHSGGGCSPNGGSGKDCWHFNIGDIVSVYEAATTKRAFIVISEEGAATYPFKHRLLVQAVDEAKRLSNKDKPGVKFTVYQAVSEVVTPKVEPVVTMLDAA